MKVFCDTSVLLAASKSAHGASRALFSLSRDAGWILQTSHWVIGETERNLDKLGGEAAKSWEKLKPELCLMADVVSIDRALVFPVPKDRPVLVTALAWSDVLVTLDREDFIQLLGSSCYGMPILLPVELLSRERAAGRLPAREDGC